MELRFQFSFRDNGRVAKEYIDSHRTLDTLSRAQDALNAAFDGRKADDGFAFSSYWSYGCGDAVSKLVSTDPAGQSEWSRKDVAKLCVTRKGGVDILTINNIDQEWLNRQDYILDRLIIFLSKAGFGYILN